MSRIVPLYAIPAPYMLDAGGRYSDAVRYTLEELDRGSYRLLVDAGRRVDRGRGCSYPVAIDPTIVKIIARARLPLVGLCLSG